MPFRSSKYVFRPELPASREKAVTADGDGSGLLIETDVGQQPTAGRPPIGMPGADGEVKRSLLVREHWPVMLVLAAFVVAGLVYSLVLPLGEVSDETSHFALVRFIAEQGRAPLSNQERQAIGIKGDASPFYHGLVALLSQHVDVSSLPTLPASDFQRSS